MNTHASAKAKAKATAAAKLYAFANAFLRHPIIASGVLTGAREYVLSGGGVTGFHVGDGWVDALTDGPTERHTYKL